MRILQYQKKWSGFVLLFFTIILTTQAEAGVPEVSEVMVTDITTRSFSVIWKSNEPSTPSLKVFNGSDCLTPTANAVITPSPIASGDMDIADAAEDNGIMKVTVTGLSPDTEYCYQTVTTSKSSSDITIAPVTPEKVLTKLLTVRTYLDDLTQNIKPFANDLILFQVFEPDQQTFSEGSLLVAEGPGGAKLSAFVGDGIASPYALIDLNNLFTADTRVNMDLLGCETLILREFKGDAGCADSATIVRFRKVPFDNELTAIKVPMQCFFADNDCSGKVDILDVQRGLNIFNTKTGDCNYNSDLDIVADGVVNILDIQGVLNRFSEVVPCQ
jgi:hypothetical protein